MSFLSRLSRIVPEPVVDSVLRNLQCLLNSKRGYGSVLESFGLGEYHGMGSTQNLLEILTAEILSTVKKYEPRIEEPAVTLTGRDHKLWVRFELTGQVEGVAHRFYIDMDSKYLNVKVWYKT